MITFHDYHGIVHRVHNVNEVLSTYELHNFVPNWQVCVACCSLSPVHEEISVHGFAGDQANLGDTSRGDIVTCLDCVVTPCGHDITFDPHRAQNLNVAQVRDLFPRLDGPCPLGCGYDGIHYASFAHYLCGDW